MLVYPLAALLAVCTTAVTAILVARQLPAPTAKLLLGACLFVFVAMVSQVVVVPSPVREVILAATGAQLPGDYWLALVLGLLFPANGLWLLFSVRYTGRGNRLRRQVTALVVILAGLYYVAPLVALSQWSTELTATRVVVNSFASGLFFMSTFSSLGSLLVLEAALRRNAIPLGEGVMLAGGASLFVYAPIAGFNLEQPIAIPALLFGASVLLGIAVTRYPVFEVLPVARIAARDRLVEGMDDAVLLVDDQHRVIEHNRAADSLLDIDTEAREQRLQDAIPGVPAPAEFAAADEPFRLRAAGLRLEVTASQVSGEYGTSVGYLLVCRDVTERLRRERRLHVLTRFLAGTVGERTASIVSQGSQLADGGEDSAHDPTALAGDIRRTTGSLKRLVAGTRRVERALSDHGTGPSDVVAVAQTVAAERAQVALVVDSTDAEATAAVDSEVLRAVLYFLLEDWIERSSEGVELVVRPDREPGPVLELQQKPPATTRKPDTAREPASDVTHEQAAHRARPGSRVEPTVALSRLALEDFGGRIDRPDEDTLRLQLRSDPPTPAGDALASDHQPHTTSQEWLSHTENTGDRQ